MSDQELQSAEFLQDPFPFYQEWRNNRPIWRSERLGGHVVSRFDDVRRVIAEHKTFRQSKSWDRALIDMLRGNPLLVTDDPEHRRLRRQVADLFSPKKLERRLTPIAERLAAELLDGLGDRFDACGEFLDPFAGRLHSELMGTGDSKELYELYMSLMDAYASSRGQGGGRVSQDVLDAGEAMLASLATLLDERIANPADDLISDLAKKDLTRQEILLMAATVMMAGVDTSLRGIATAFAGLDEFHDQWDQVKANPEDLALPALEEALRWAGPVQIKRREVAVPTELVGVQFSEGDQVVALMGAANRDPDHFENPDEFDIGRPNANHLGFGAGVHYCVGAPIARVLAQVGIVSLMTSFPNLSVDREVAMEWDGPVRRGPKELWMRKGN